MTKKTLIFGLVVAIGAAFAVPVLSLAAQPNWSRLGVTNIPVRDNAFEEGLFRMLGVVTAIDTTSSNPSISINGVPITQSAVTGSGMNTSNIHFTGVNWRTLKVGDRIRVSGTVENGVVNVIIRKIGNITPSSPNTGTGSTSSTLQSGTLRSIQDQISSIRTQLNALWKGVMGTPLPPNTGTNSTVQVSITDNSFSPKTITIPLNGTVTWTNNTSVAHTVTADNGSFNSGTIAPGGTFSWKFVKAGDHSYHCTIHPNMTGTVTVTSSSTSSSSTEQTGRSSSGSYNY